MPPLSAVDDLTDGFFMTSKTVTSHRDDPRKPWLIFSKMIIHGQFQSFKMFKDIVLDQYKLFGARDKVFLNPILNSWLMLEDLNGLYFLKKVCNIIEFYVP